jgi:hypothetical protein
MREWNWSSWWWGMVAGVATLMVVSIIGAWIQNKGSAKIPEMAASAEPTPSLPPPAPAPAGPPCVREACAERPAGLRCLDTLYSRDEPCKNYRIDYEHHCDCVEWGGPQ